MARQGAPAPPAMPASVEHQSAGRVRVRVGREHRSPEHMERVRAQLEAHPDVHSVEVNPRTGSVLVRGDDIGRLRAALGGFLELVDEAGPDNVQEAGIESVVVLVSQVDRRIQQATGSRLSLRWLVPASFIAIAIRQLFRSGFTVGELPWFVLLYYGVDSFLKLYPHHAPKAPSPPTGTAA
jgi:hypothetical protein